MQQRQIFMCAIVAVGLIGGHVAADELRTAAEKTAACRVITDPLERLACLDAAAEDISRTLEVSPAETVAAPAPTTSVPAVPEEPKWATAPTPPPEPVHQVANTATSDTTTEERKPIWARIIPRRADGPKSINFIDVTITRITRNNAGRYFFYTRDDGVWRQLFVADVDLPEVLPMNATISKTGLGGSPSIRFAEPDHNSYKVRRIE